MRQQLGRPDEWRKLCYSLTHTEQQDLIPAPILSIPVDLTCPISGIAREDFFQQPLLHGAVLVGPDMAEQQNGPNRNFCISSTQPLISVH